MKGRVTKRGPPPEGDKADYLRAIRDAYPPALGTSDVADKIGVSRQTADRHLRNLVEEGLLATDMVGTVRVWWLTDDGRAFLDPDYGPESQ